MRLCSAEGVLQLVTCNRTPKVGWRNSGGTCPRTYKKEWPNLDSLPPNPPRRDCMPSWIWLGTPHSQDH